MKSGLGMLISLLASIIVIVGAALIWYVSTTATFSRTDQQPAPTAAGLPQNR